jgi:hypothetical protein
MTSLPAYIDPELWEAFVEMRKKIKAPMTDYAQKLIIMKLMGFHANGWDANSSLRESVINSWKGVFTKDRRDTSKPDAALLKIEEDSKKAAPMPADVRAKIAAMTRRIVA